MRSAVIKWYHFTLPFVTFCIIQKCCRKNHNIINAGRRWKTFTLYTRTAKRSLSVVHYSDFYVFHNINTAILFNNKKKKNTHTFPTKFLFEWSESLLRIASILHRSVAVWARRTMHSANRLNIGSYTFLKDNVPNC